MKRNGIRISDGQGDVLRVQLSDILTEIPDGRAYYWAILFLDGTPNPGQEAFLIEYEKKINKSEDGLYIKWEELVALSDKYFQMFETIILGCKDTKLLRRYVTEKEMYTTCDIILDLIDCAFWEVYSKDASLINRLASKFKQIKILQ